VSVRSAVRAGLDRAVALVPQRVKRQVFRAWLRDMERWPDPRRALRELLELEAELEDGLDHTAIRYDDGVHAKHRLMRYHDFFVDRIRPGERVLDLGCGKGELAADVAARAGAHVTGVDWNPDYLRFGRGRYADVEFVQADLREFEPDHPYDVLVLSNVLEHLPGREELLRGLVARTGASRLLIRVPLLARSWTVPLRQELGLPHFSDPTHEVEYDRESFAAEMRAAGFEVVHEELAWGELWAEVRPAP
jgi:SAM-dependent methyltransferase